MTVWIYVNTGELVGDRDHLKVFASEKAADTWLQENDPEGVASSNRPAGGHPARLSFPRLEEP
jgi:hypothetical protein